MDAISSSSLGSTKSEWLKIRMTKGVSGEVRR